MRARSPSSASLAALFLILPMVGGAERAAAQDVELLGRHHGTTPPPAYFTERGRDPQAFRFRSEGADRLRRLRERGTTGSGRTPAGGDQALAYALGPRDGPLEGTFHVPVVLGLFHGSTEPGYGASRVQAELFDGPNSYGQTLTEFYSEMSGGMLEIRGAAFPWVRTSMDAEEVSLNASGLISHSSDGIGAYVEEIVRALDEQGVDWSVYDNSGDGFVDVLMVVHPTAGAECDGNPERIWSHRWSLDRATQGRLAQGMETSTPRPDGIGFIRVNDYTVQPMLACGGDRVNEIGVVAHELGHGLGLPDLYGTQGSAHPGAGRWDLMGSGGWGCRGADASRPCQMGAWSKAMLGWVDVIDLEADVDHGTLLIPPVQTSGLVYRVGAVDGSADYLLLENRQRLGADERLWEPGLLVWHVDPTVVNGEWTNNAVNRDPERMGVWLRQADGLNSLAGSGPSHGDPGDPYPGCIKDDYWHYVDPSRPCVRTNPEFHAGSFPAARTHAGPAFGTTITGIRSTGSAPHDIELELTTRQTRIQVEAELLGSRNRPLADEVVLVDGQPVSGIPATVVAAPFDRRTLEAPAGRPLGDGVRVGFRGWSDGAPRVRELEVPVRDTVLRVAYGGDEVQLRWEPSSTQDGVEPGRLETEPGSPDLWFPRGTEVLLRAAARPGFSFREWDGALAESPNPTTVRLDDPVTVAALFDYHYGFVDVPVEVKVEAAANRAIQLQVEGGEGPIRWRLVEGTLPDGMAVRPGRISGSAMEVGEFPVRVRATDASGLAAEVEMLIEVLPPRISGGRLTAPLLGESPGPTPLQRAFVDRVGNGNGAYDVGDLRAFLRAFGSSAEEDGAEASSAPTVRFRFPEAPNEEGRR